MMARLDARALRAVVTAGLIALAAGPALAVLPDEILADPVLEERARLISREIRCPVCQSESIDDSDAPISRDLRLIIRERLVAGDDNQDVIEFLTERYGEFILFNPPPKGSNLVLWLAGPVMLVLAVGGVALSFRSRARRAEARAQGLSEAEEARLRELMKD